MKKIKFLSWDQAGIPVIHLPKNKGKPSLKEPTLFDLSSHTRARQAMDFALKTRHLQFHTYVIGEDQSGRMTATLAFLNQQIKNLAPPPDWVYLNNFAHPHRPKPFQLPPGMGTELRDHLAELVETLQSLLIRTFTHPDFVSQLETMTASLEEKVNHQINELRTLAHTQGMEIEQGPQGFTIHPYQEDMNPASDINLIINDLRERLTRITSTAHLANRQLMLDIKRVKIAVADHAISPHIHRFCHRYESYLGEWIQELKQDILTHLELFLREETEGDISTNALILERYAVNLLIDNKHVHHPKVFLETNPTYENLFGSLKYRTSPIGGMETNFTMIRPGALHIANGGILVLRADALAKDTNVWDMLKGALRDGHIRIEELHREHTLPLLDAPEPKPIPLNLQVFIIGSPLWFYSFFYLDPDFKTFFKVKADIDPDLPVTPKNIKNFAKLLDQSAQSLTHMEVNDDAKAYLIGYSSRWIGHRKRMTARFELIADVLGEASVFAKIAQRNIISLEDIRNALYERRHRNACLEDRTHQDIVEGLVNIKTRGETIGQINGLAVYGNTDHFFGLPSRITARTYVGELGIINIERLTDMSGPIQQKGALILDGLLNGIFSQDFPVSFNCSLTFEQNYAGVEGDSASLAEILAIFSALSDKPLRQDIAVTGSLNQFGESQAVGGINHKIEGFFRVCRNQGFIGTQGVIIPFANQDHVVLREEVTQAMKEGYFFIWPIKHMDEAINLMMGPSKEIYRQIYKKLLSYHIRRNKRK